MHRVTISLEAELAEEFDSYVRRRCYQNRSEAVRDLVRRAVSESFADSEDAPCVANLSYIFNRRERTLMLRLLSMHHEHRELVVSVSQVLLDRDDCIETVVLKGSARRVRDFANDVCVERGVRFGALNLITAQAREDAIGAEHTDRRASTSLTSLLG